MRNYIQERIKAPIALFMAMLHDDIAHDFDVYSFPASSIRGSVTDRTQCKDSFIAGTVIQEGTTKMLRCTVAKDVTLILHDGAVVADCAFGAQFSDTRGKRVIEIGRNAVVAESSIIVNTKLGDASCIYRSCLSSDDPAASMTETDKITIGDGTCVFCSYLAFSPPEGRDITQSRNVEIGNGGLLLSAKIISSSPTTKIGDNFIAGQYGTLLHCCFTPITEYALDLHAHPSAGDRRSGLTEARYNRRPHMTVRHNTVFGNDCMLMGDILLIAAGNTKATTSFEAGNGVYLVDTSMLQAGPDSGESGHPESMFLSNSVKLGDGCTVVLHGATAASTQRRSKIEVGEGATVEWFTKPLSSASVLPETVKVKPYSLARL